MKHLAKSFYCCLIVFFYVVNLSAYDQNYEDHCYDPFNAWISCLAYQNCTFMHNDRAIFTFGPIYYQPVSNLINEAKKQRKMLEFRCQKKKFLDQFVLSDRPVEFRFSKVRAEDITFQRNSRWPFSTNRKYHILSDGINVEIWLPEQVYSIIEKNRHNNSLFLINLDALFDGENYKGYLYLSDVIKLCETELQSH